MYLKGYQHPDMNITKTLYVTSRAAWRKWLEEYYKSEPEIWLVGYRKATGQPNLPYNTAVEEALCFGWIDSIRKNLDQERYAQRFSPRKPGTPYSQTNKERLKKLIEQGKVAAEVLETIDRDELETFEFPADILAALQANPTSLGKLSEVRRDVPAHPGGVHRGAAERAGRVPQAPGAFHPYDPGG